MRSRIHAVRVLLLSVIVVAACQDRSAVAPTHNSEITRADVLDGAAGGNAHFFFLPPMVANPSPTGQFNPALAPTVEVCQTTALDASGHCSALRARFTTAGGVNNNNARVEVVVSGEHYRLNWDTKAYAIPVDQPFRIVVLLGDLKIGHADVVARKGGKYQNATTGVEISLVNGRTLPIKFRIENGVICGGALECFEGQVGPEGGTFTVAGANDTRPAGTSFPPGAVEDTVNLIIERVTDGECLPTDLQQFQRCYRFRTEPYVPNFIEPVTVGVCMSDAAGLDFFNDGQLRLWKWSEHVGEALQELERVQIEYLVCPELSIIGSRTPSPWMRGLAKAGSVLSKPLALLFAPRPAYAMFGPYEGGRLSNFSRIGWVRPISLEITQGDGQSGFTSMTLPINPTVRLTNRYGATKQAVPGKRVDFTPSGDGQALPSFTLTDAAGSASTVWTLSSSAGANSLLAHVATSRVIAPAPYEVQVTFNANVAQRPAVDFLPPLQESTGTGTATASFSPTVVISEVNGAQLATLTPTLDIDAYKAQWNVPTLDPLRIYRIEIQIFGIALGHVDLQPIGNELRNVATGEKVLNLDNSRNLPIKFRLLQ